jgi:hypothetical protein
MRKTLTFACAMILSTLGWAEDNGGSRLNTVTLSLHAEQWLTTKSAVVNVSINASVADQGIEKVRSNVMQKLQQIAGKGEWHIVSFNRQQDQSGLESIQMSAQARLEQADLTGLRDKAKSISKAGETYRIDNIEFTPSEDEIRAANTALRAHIYQQAKAEIDTLNTQYPTQKYSLHKIDFLMLPTPQPMMARNMMYEAKAASVAASPPLAVGNKAELTATVEIASVISPPVTTAPA